MVVGVSRAALSPHVESSIAANILPPVSLEEPGRLKPGRTVEYIVWDREWKLFWGSPPQGRGQKNKGHRWTHRGGERHMYSCVHGGRWAGRGHQGLSTQTGEKSPVAYKPDKVPPESGGRAVRAL